MLELARAATRDIITEKKNIKGPNRRARALDEALALLEAEALNTPKTPMNVRNLKALGA